MAVVVTGKAFTSGYYLLKFLCYIFSDLEKKLRRRLSNFCEWVGYDAAPEVEDCKENKYRSFDGVCNNIDNPNWGKAGYPYLRLLPSAYKDGK